MIIKTKIKTNLYIVLCVHIEILELRNDSIGTAKVIYRICVLRVKSSICYTKKTMLMSLMHQLSVTDECMTLTVDAGSISFIHISCAFISNLIPIWTYLDTCHCKYRN